MPYTPPENIEDITLFLEPYEVPESNGNITLFLGTEIPPEENPDYVLQEIKRVENDAYVDQVLRRVHEGSYIEQRIYRCINPDNEAPSVNNNELIGTYIDGTVEVDFEKATDDKTPDTQLRYQLYYSFSNELNSLDAIDSFGTLINSGTDVSKLVISGLSIAQVVYANVVVRDLAGNRTAYAGAVVQIDAAEILSFEILDDNFFIQSGNSRQVAFSVQGAGDVDTSVTWQSSDADVLTVDGGGIVTGVSQGTVQLTMTSNEDPSLTRSILIGVDTYEFQAPSQPISFTTEEE